MTRAASGTHQQLHHHVSRISLECLIRVLIPLLSKDTEPARTEHGKAAHPIQHVGPALHGDALKHCQHGKQKVVEVGDTTIGSLPAFSTLTAIDGALAPMP